MDNHEKMDTLLESLMEFMNLLPQATVKLINPIRYRAMMESVFNLKNLLADEYEEGEINIQINDKLNLGAVSVELEDFSVSNMQKFLKILVTADCFEVFPLTNGQLRVELTFQGMLKALC